MSFCVRGVLCLASFSLLAGKGVDSKSVLVSLPVQVCKGVDLALDENLLKRDLFIMSQIEHLNLVFHSFLHLELIVDSKIESLGMEEHFELIRALAIRNVDDFARRNAHEANAGLGVLFFFEESSVGDEVSVWAPSPVFDSMDCDGFFLAI